MPEDVRVPGFPDYLSFGGITDLQDANGTDFVNARASAIFKYAGRDGAGDTAEFLNDDQATRQTIQLAANTKNQIGNGHSVLPVIVSYTCDLSAGDPKDRLQDQSALKHGFGNLILSLKIATQAANETVPAGYILNPDFLAECQIGLDGQSLPPDSFVSVRAPLEEALGHHQVDINIPESITDTLRGYIKAVNWLLRTVGKGVTFAWLASTRGAGSSAWIYSEDAKDTPKEVAQKVAAYIKSLGVYESSLRPDFLAVDRHEADDFTNRAVQGGHVYGPREWDRFFDFCAELGSALQAPVMPFQISSSRIPVVDDHVVDIDAEHWGTGGTYLFGDSTIGANNENIHPKILAIQPGSMDNARTVEDVFKRGEGFDLTTPSYTDFAKRGIFCVMLGGGSTTGIIGTTPESGKWTQRQLQAYMENPIPLRST